MTALSDAIDDVINTINEQGRGGGYRHDQVAMQWPTLAAALAELMDTCGYKPPGSWRVAQREVQNHA